ncbi:MAG TPA: DegV family protein [Thermoflexales bacterium]|nr:DegV family protein [Thermoflexales bacterium]HQW36894.1 DegV family protein [Thermoflexales bacterium]HQZ22928.1 DegV family protein [Thermoflexales bacterium]HRA01255.1 DegV family protein [Thermoflexales bacterium]
MKIITDCAADMSAEELKEFNIAQAPLFIQFPGEEVSAENITADAFYNRLEAMRPAIPTTAQPSPAQFEEIYRKLLETETDKRLLSIHISSGLSGVINGARVAASDIGDQAQITLWDTMTLSGGERFQVLAAALAARKGKTLDEIQTRMEELRANTEVVYTLETLEYLQRGGRIGRVSALAGALFNIKPVINVDRKDGKYSNIGKVRSVQQGLSFIVEHLQKMYGQNAVWTTVLHGRMADKADALAEQLKSKLNVAKMEIRRISPVLGVHTGPGIVGVAVAPMRLMEDLL